MRALKIPEIELEESDLGPMLSDDDYSDGVEELADSEEAERDVAMKRQQRAQQRVLDESYMDHKMTAGDEVAVNDRIEQEKEQDALYRCAQLDPQKRKAVAKAAARAFSKKRLTELNELISRYEQRFKRALHNDFDTYFGKAGMDDDSKLICYTFVLRKQLHIGVSTENEDGDGEGAFDPVDDEYIGWLHEHLTSDAAPSEKVEQCVDYMCQQDGGAKTRGAISPEEWLDWLTKIQQENLKGGALASAAENTERAKQRARDRAAEEEGGRKRGRKSLSEAARTILQSADEDYADVEDDYEDELDGEEEGGEGEGKAGRHHHLNGRGRSTSRGKERIRVKTGGEEEEERAGGEEEREEDGEDGEDYYVDDDRSLDSGKESGESEGIGGAVDAARDGTKNVTGDADVAAVGTDDGEMEAFKAKKEAMLIKQAREKRRESEADGDADNGDAGEGTAKGEGEYKNNAKDTAAGSKGGKDEGGKDEEGGTEGWGYDIWSEAKATKKGWGGFEEVGASLEYGTDKEKYAIGQEESAAIHEAAVAAAAAADLERLQQAAKRKEEMQRIAALPPPSVAAGVALDVPLPVNGTTTSDDELVYMVKDRPRDPAVPKDPVKSERRFRLPRDGLVLVVLDEGWLDGVVLEEPGARLQLTDLLGDEEDEEEGRDEGEAKGGTEAGAGALTLAPGWHSVTVTLVNAKGQMLFPTTDTAVYKKLWFNYQPTGSNNPNGSNDTNGSNGLNGTEVQKGAAAAAAAAAAADDGDGDGGGSGADADADADADAARIRGSERSGEGSYGGRGGGVRKTCKDGDEACIPEDGSSGAGIASGDTAGGANAVDAAPASAAPATILDSTAVVDVVLAAGRSIGRAKSEKQQEGLRQIASAMRTEHWIETAADLRGLVADPDEWATLPVPAKLKLGIKQVLAR
jgi:hypothetical protein